MTLSLAAGRSESWIADNADIELPKYDGAAAQPEQPAAPCAGCVELNVDVNAINQRDEFSFDAGGAAITRVVWTILVNFNSDQLAVQPFVDDQFGKYTDLHVNTFPVGTPVQVEQRLKRKAHTIGLIVGSSGAWTGNQTMSVFVDSVASKAPAASKKTFDTSPEGLIARANEHHPKVVAHPAEPGPTARVEHRRDR